MILEKILNATKKMKKLAPSLLAIFIADGFIVSLSGCSKKCGECHPGQYRVVNNPKKGQCYCCPNDTKYNSQTGTCDY